MTPTMDWLAATYGTVQLPGSAVHEIEPYLEGVLGWWPQRVLEIGTGNGYSALMWAMHGAHVDTIDLRVPTDPAQVDVWKPDRFAIADQLWIRAGVRDRVSRYVVETNKGKLAMLRDMDEEDPPARFDFDLVFVDGDHTVEGVELDWAATAHHGRTLFHDYRRDLTPAFEALTRWLDDMGGRRVGPHALLWEA